MSTGVQLPLSATRITDDDFERLRREVLRGWPTGVEVDRDQAVAFHRAQPTTKNVALVLGDARREGQTLIQPRGGVALVGEQIELLQYLEGEGEADLLPMTLDSYTRNLRYEDASRAIAESERTGRSLLNGFPIVNHGVSGVRRVVDAVPRPVVGRVGCTESRLACEIGLAGGLTDWEEGFDQGRHRDRHWRHFRLRPSAPAGASRGIVRSRPLDVAAAQGTPLANRCRIPALRRRLTGRGRTDRCSALGQGLPSRRDRSLMSYSL